MTQAVSKETRSGDRDVATITREFDFPRESVFRMFTDPKKAEKWFGTPGEAANVLFELDARPGGRIRIYDQQPGESLHKTDGTVLEVTEPERFAFRSTTILEDDKAPFEAMQTVTLESIAPRRTRMVVTVKVLSAGSFPGGVAGLVQGFIGGWGESLDKLQTELR